MKETPEQFMEARRFANKSAPLHIGDNMPDPNTCGNEYAALTGSPYAPRFKEQAYVAEINQLLARVAELEAELVAQWKWDDGSILRKRRIEKLIPAETLNA